MVMKKKNYLRSKIPGPEAIFALLEWVEEKIGRNIFGEELIAIGLVSFLIWFAIIGAFFIGTSITIAILISAYDTKIVHLMSHPLFIIPAFAIGIYFYRLRCRRLLIYGLIEILVAGVAIWLAIGSTTELLLLKSLGIIGGVYILVRGIDNVDKCIGKEYPAIRSALDRMFHDKYEKQRDAPHSN